MKGTEVKKILSEKGWKQTDVAKKMGISSSHLGNILRTDEVSLNWLQKIETVTDIPFIIIATHPNQEPLITCESQEDYDNSSSYPAEITGPDEFGFITYQGRRYIPIDIIEPDTIDYIETIKQLKDRIKDLEEDIRQKRNHISLLSENRKDQDKSKANSA